jgi:hypothetical protein
MNCIVHTKEGSAHLEQAQSWNLEDLDQEVESW